MAPNCPGDHASSGLFGAIPPTNLDRDRFTKTVQVTRLKTARRNLHIVRRLLRKYVYRIHNHKAFERTNKEQQDNTAYIYLDGGLVKTWDDLPNAVRQEFEEYGLTSCSLEPYDLRLGYDNMPADEIFKHLLPEGSEGISSFTSVGHLIHVNVRDELKPYRHLIGQVLLDKNSQALAVVNKSNIIDNTYRNFAMEIVAKRDAVGDKPDSELLLVQVKENDCRFKLDFSSVYWNSRLGTEHERIVKKFQPDLDIVFDLCAGVGPFSIPAARMNCAVYANDLNPECIKWLRCNAKLNRVESQLHIYNLDARDFIRNELTNLLLEQYKRLQTDPPHATPRIHIMMNLPAIAVEFLPCFVGLFTHTKDELLKLHKLYEHIVHCYCFLKGDYSNPKIAVRQMIEKNLGMTLEEDELLDMYNVRHVAPKKDMYRVDIKLSARILFAAIPDGGHDGSDVKRLKV
ncbi:tRNA (guanine(37)-N1)-methyltransferase, partial [Fragariocoptes setiger]